jgi:hypothetical protein
VLVSTFRVSPDVILAALLSLTVVLVSTFTSYEPHSCVSVNFSLIV